MLRWSLLLAVVPTACTPDFGAFEVVPGQLVVDDRDGGTATPSPVSPATPAEPDLGQPCSSPYVAVGLYDQSGSTDRAGQIRRYDLGSLGSGQECRATSLSRQHLAFGTTVYSVVDVGNREVVGVSDAVLGLDAEGFPAWRFQPEFPGGSFLPLQLVSLKSGGREYVAVLYWIYQSSSTADGILVLDPSDGSVAGHVEELPYGLVAIAPDPGDPSRLLAGGTYSGLRSYPLLSLSSLGEPTEVLGHVAEVGALVWIDADRESGRVVIAYRSAIYQWNRFAASTPAVGAICTSLCTSYLAAVADPSSSSASIVVCSGESANHLVRLDPDAGSCQQLVDGTLLGTLRMQSAAVIGR